MPVIHIIVYSFTLWFGLYLLARNPQKIGLRYAGLGLVSYALSIALALFLRDDPHWLRLPAMLPSVFWLGAALHLLPDVPLTEKETLLLRLAGPYTLVVFAAGFFDSTIARWMSLLVPFFLMFGLLIRLRHIAAMGLPRPPLVIMGTGTLFMLMSSSLVLLPQDWLRQDWVALTISLDLLLLGYAVAMLDAYDEGDAIRRESLRSLLAAALAVLILVIQVAVVSAAGGHTLALDILLFALITTVLVSMIFYDRFQALLDRLMLRESEARYRENLRSVSDAIVRRSEDNTLAEMDDAEFNRITRRALSYYGDLNKLAASPLMQLDSLQAYDSLLERANALKGLLRENVEKLRPTGDAEFAPQDEWRYYNVLHFPYIRGLRPYSIRAAKDDLTGAERQAAEWFRVYVPERTLYNWQKSAAELVAQSLREHERHP